MCLALLSFLVMDPLAGCGGNWAWHSCGPGFTREEAKLPERWDAAMTEYTFDDRLGVLTLRMTSAEVIAGLGVGFPIQQALACSPNWPDASGQVIVTYTWTPYDATSQPITNMVVAQGTLEVQGSRISSLWIESEELTVQLRENSEDKPMTLRVSFFRLQTPDGVVEVPEST